MRCSFVLKVAPNRGKRYGELPKAIPCNILKYNRFIHVACKAWNCSSFFFQTLASPQAIPVAIPFWYINARKSILFTHGFPLVEFQLWTRKKRSCDVLHTWPASSKNPGCEPVIMNTDNFNSIIYIPCMYL